MSHHPNEYKNEGENSNRRAQKAPAENEAVQFEDLTTEQQNYALALLRDKCAGLIGRAIADNLQAVRNQRLFNLLADTFPGNSFDCTQ